MFVMPEALQAVAKYQTWEGIVPKKLFHDFRSEELKAMHKIGTLSNTLKDKMDLFAIKPKMSFCAEMGEQTYPSVWHYDVLNLIVFCYCNPINY